MARYLRRGRYFTAIVVALCALLAANELGALPHELVEHDSREGRAPWLRALGIGVMIVVLGVVSMVTFSRKRPPLLPRAAIRS